MSFSVISYDLKNSDSDYAAELCSLHSALTAEVKIMAARS